MSGAVGLDLRFHRELATRIAQLDADTMEQMRLGFRGLDAALEYSRCSGYLAALQHVRDHAMEIEKTMTETRA